MTYVELMKNQEEEVFLVEWDNGPPGQPAKRYTFFAGPLTKEIVEKQSTFQSGDVAEAYVMNEVDKELFAQCRADFSRLQGMTWTSIRVLAGSSTVMGATEDTDA